MKPARRDSRNVDLVGFGKIERGLVSDRLAMQRVLESSIQRYLRKRSTSPVVILGSKSTSIDGSVIAMSCIPISTNASITLLLYTPPLDSSLEVWPRLGSLESSA
jgi:hypothetical protein